MHTDKVKTAKISLPTGFSSRFPVKFYSQNRKVNPFFCANFFGFFLPSAKKKREKQSFSRF